VTWVTDGPPTWVDHTHPINIRCTREALKRRTHAVPRRVGTAYLPKGNDHHALEDCYRYPPLGEPL
jgi:hypothetical protein